MSSNNVNLSLPVYSLPEDITIEILLRLPIESVRTCKCVSKQWKNVIDHPDFIKRYRTDYSAFFLCQGKLYCLSQRLTRRRFLLCGSRCPSFKLRHIPSVVIDNKFVYHDLLLGSSSRIACVKAVHGEFHLFDLLTGDSHVVRDVPLGKYSNYWRCYGFGYDPYADDYKIVVVCPNINKVGFYERSNYHTIPSCESTQLQNHDCTLIFVYSLANRGWKCSLGFPCSAYGMHSTREQAYSFNGALHWLLVKISGKQVIGVLDLHSYTLVEIVLPTACNNRVITNVAEIDGQLCFCLLQSDGWFSVWVMKEYGVAESWTELFSIDQSRIVGTSSERLTPTLVYQCGDGRKLVLLVVSGSPKMNLLWYDIDNKEVEIVDKSWREKWKLPVLSSDTTEAIERLAILVVSGLIKGIIEIVNLDYDFEFHLD